MAQRDVASFKATKNSRFADNTSGLITEASHRDTHEDVADSFLNKTDDLQDDDTFASASASKVPSSESVKAYVDSQVSSSSIDTYARIFEDFDIGVTGFFNLTSFNNGGGIGATSSLSTFGQDGTENAIGVLELPSGATTAGGCALSNTVYRHSIGFGAIHTITFRAALSALSDGTNTYSARLGYMNAYATIASTTNGAYFRYTHGTNGGRWQAVCISGGTETAADTGVAASAGSTFAIFKIVINANGTQVDFYIDGVLTNAITTNIPTASGMTVGQAAVMEKTAGTTSRSLYLDYVEKTISRTTAR